MKISLPISRRARCTIPIAVALFVACRGDDATRPQLETAEPVPVDGFGDSQSIVLVPDGRVLRAAISVADSADVPIRIATVRLSGEAGDTVALSLATEQEVLDSAGPRVRLQVADGVVLRTLPLLTMVDGVTVF